MPDTYVREAPKSRIQVALAKTYGTERGMLVPNGTGMVFSFGWESMPERAIVTFEVTVTSSKIVPWALQVVMWQM